MTINLNNTYFGIGSSGVNHLFSNSGFFGGGGDLLSNTNLYSGFSEVNSIGYKHLLKAYYQKDKDTDKDSSSKNDTIDNLLNQSNTTAANAAAAKKLTSDATDLKESADEITRVDKDGNMELFTKDRKKIDSAIKKFVNDYNDLVKTVSSSKYGNNRMSDLRSQLTALSSASQYSLKKAGITASSNGSLSIDEKIYEKVNIDTLKELFTNSNSFTDRVAEKADYIKKNAARYTTDSYGTYNQNYNYNNLLNAGNLFNGFF